MKLELSKDFKNVDGEILRSLNISGNGGGVETASERRLCAWDVLAIGHSDRSEGDAQKGVVQHARFSERALEKISRRFRRLLSLFRHISSGHQHCPSSAVIFCQSI